MVRSAECGGAVPGGTRSDSRQRLPESWADCVRNWLGTNRCGSRYENQQWCSWLRCPLRGQQLQSITARPAESAEVERGDKEHRPRYVRVGPACRCATFILVSIGRSYTRS